MSLTQDQLANRARQLLADEVLMSVIDGLVEEKTAAFCGRSASEAEVIEARHGVWALEEITVRLQALVDDQAFAARRNAKAGPA